MLHHNVFLKSNLKVEENVAQQANQSLPAVPSIVPLPTPSNGSPPTPVKPEKSELDQKILNALQR